MNHQASYVMNLSLKRHKDTRFNVTNRCQITPMPSKVIDVAPIGDQHVGRTLPNS